MAQVFQCDACGKNSVEKAGTVKLDGTPPVARDLCSGCWARVDTVLNPKPRGPKPAGK